MDKYVGAIDQGTTSTRFIVFDHDGTIVARAQKEHAQICPRPGWVEHDPAEILANVEEVAATALRSGGLTAADLDAVGITNQRETTVLWHRGTGVPLHNALVWQDTRVAAMVAGLATAGGVDRFRAMTGLPLASYFSAPKLRWLLDSIPDAPARAAAGELAFGTIDTWLLWNLSGGVHGGVHATDVTNASRTQLMNLSTLAWDPALLAAFGIAPQLLPAIRSSSEVYACANSGALRGVPIAALLGDQQAALVGQTCFDAGQVKNTYGTGCFLLLNTGERAVASSAGLITTVAYRFGTAPARYALEGSVAVAGGLVQWLRDQLGLIGSSAEIEGLARSVADNGGVYVVPAFSGLFAPYWRPDARGVIAGLTQYANRGHLARAALEAAAYQTCDVLSAMEQDTGIAITQLCVDGGMSVNELLMQFQADVLDAPVQRPRVTETTALGAAYAAGLATGYWHSLDDLRANWSVESTWQPRMSPPERERLLHDWHKAVTRTLAWS